jgi:2-isopropylmalate synthase
VVVFYPTSQIHLDRKMNKSQDQAMAIITDHVRYARSLGLKVRYTP